MVVFTQAETSRVKKTVAARRTVAAKYFFKRMNGGGRLGYNLQE